MKLISFLLLSTLLVTACSHSNSDNVDPKKLGPNDPKPTKPYSDAAECAQFTSKLPNDFFHDYLEVPENPAEPQGQQIKIFYYGKLVEGKTPIVFYNGGPGGDSHSTYEVLMHAKESDPLWKTTSLVFIDQRGNGCSSGYPQGSSDETLERLRLYGSTHIVYDSEAVRKHLLGDKPWKAGGQSYGAWIAHRYAVVAPEGLSAVYAHANTINDNPLERGANRIASQGRVFEVYLQKYPADREAMRILLAELATTKCYKSPYTSDKACGYELIEGFTARLGFVPDWAYMHKWISVLTKDGHINEDKMNDYATKVVFYGSGDPSNKKDLAGFVIGFYDRNVPDFNHDTCLKFFDMIRAQGEKAETFMLHECMSAIQFPSRLDDEASELKMQNHVVGKFGTDHLTVEKFKSALDQSPNLPFYLYSGELDPFVPKASFVEELLAVGTRVHYTNFPTSGHDGFYTEHQFAVDATN